MTELYSILSNSCVLPGHMYQNVSRITVHSSQQGGTTQVFIYNKIDKLCGICTIK